MTMTANFLDGSGLLVGSVAVSFAAGIAVPIASAPSPQGDLVLVIVPPWRGAEQMVIASGGQPIGPVQASFATLARYDTAIPAEALQAQGAWAVIDGTPVAYFCGVAGTT